MRSPRAIGVIMDGNRRWAKERGKPTLDGHRAGQEKLKEFLAWARARDIEEVTVYAFSTENWNRTSEEIDYLMNLLEHALETQFEDFIKEGGRIRFIGERERFPEKLQACMAEAERKSERGKSGTLVVALSYGGRAEILAAARSLAAHGTKDIDEASFKDAMWSADLLDPDLIIRTGGDQRLSNFLTWQSTYSELFFTETKWPDFSEEEFEVILREYGERDRRHGT